MTRTREGARPDDATAARVVSASERKPRTGACLVVIQGREIGRDFRLRRRLYVLGRDPGADVPVPDDSVSRRHAQIEIEPDPDGGAPLYWLSDLGSTNGSFVNGSAVQRTRLRNGDRIQIGDTILKFALLDEVEARFHREIRDRLRYDGLTGLLTRESLFLALEPELQRAVQLGRPLSVLMMDLDRFKGVNDAYGHLIGSRVLSMVGHVIREKLRVMDVSGRYGGEEFITYLAETPAREAFAVAERIRRAIEGQELRDDDQTVRITISIGVATFPEHGRDVTALVERADRALYAAKERGRNCVVLAS